MGRVPRWRLGHGVYHIINRGINNTWILETEDDRNTFLELLVKQKTGKKISIYHWAIMSNHFHLAAESLNVKELSNYLSKVSSLYSRYWHRRHGTGRGRYNMAGEIQKHRRPEGRVPHAARQVYREESSCCRHRGDKCASSIQMVQRARIYQRQQGSSCQRRQASLLGWIRQY